MNQQNIFGPSVFGSQLYGRRKGELDSPDWKRRIPNAIEPTPWMIDFAGVTAVSSSYINATLGDILAGCTSGSYPDVYPVIRNVTEDILDEIQPCLQLRGLALWVQAETWKVAGELDTALRETLLHLTTHEGGSKELLPKATIKQAGWSNRLSALVRLRLVLRSRAGKTFNYRLTPRLIDPSCTLEAGAALFCRSPYGLS